MSALKVNAPRMVHETVDDEVIVIDLATGAYYSLAGSAAHIWALIAAGVAGTELADRVARDYGIGVGPILDGVEGFLGMLLAEALIVPNEDSASSDAPAPDPPDEAEFSTPLVEKYTDMAELILLDPVHDVSALGWPSTDGDHNP